MVKKLRRFLAYTLFFVLALMFFAPKISAYYFLEQQIKPFGVIVSSEELSDNGFSLSIENASITFKEIESANINNINIKLFALYNSVNISDIALSSTAASFVPLNVEKVYIRHSVFDPLNVHVDLKGEFGEAVGSYNILENSVHLKLTPSDIMNKQFRGTLRNLKKDENGEYIYDKAL